MIHSGQGYTPLRNVDALILAELSCIDAMAAWLACEGSDFSSTVGTEKLASLSFVPCTHGTVNSLGCIHGKEESMSLLFSGAPFQNLIHSLAPWWPQGPVPWTGY